LKKIYITGVSGFIGSSIARLCLDNGYKVIGITRKSSSIVTKELGIEVIEADLNDKKTLKLQSADAIIHCATANEILSQNINEGLYLSVIGTNKLLEASRNAQISNVVFFSTAQVYGTELNGYVDEKSPVNCQTPYATNHFLGEELCKFYCNSKNFNIVILRPSNIYGVPNISTVNRRTLVPMCFVEEAVNYGSITIHSSGKQTRNFISIEQVAEINLKIIKNFPNGFSIINCGSNYCSTVLKIANIVSDHYKKYFKKNLIINIDGDKPTTSNIFEYKSRFIKSIDTHENCEKKMSLTVSQLFKKHKDF